MYSLVQLKAHKVMPNYRHHLSFNDGLTEVRVVDLVLSWSMFPQWAVICDTANSGHWHWPIGLQQNIKNNVQCIQNAKLVVHDLLKLKLIASLHIIKKYSCISQKISFYLFNLRTDQQVVWIITKEASRLFWEKTRKSIPKQFYSYILMQTL